MSASSVTGLFIGICFVVAGLLILIWPINSKWLMTLFSQEERKQANRYLSLILFLFGCGFCIVALLPLLIDFRGLQVETFVVLATLALSLSWSLTKKHARAESKRK